MSLIKTAKDLGELLLIHTISVQLSWAIWVTQVTESLFSGSHGSTGSNKKPDDAICKSNSYKSAGCKEKSFGMNP